MKTVASVICALLLLPGSVPARADFKYTETARITGGAMVGMAKFAAAMTKTSEQASLQPSTTAHYVKGNRMRTDRPDGTVQIIDLDARQVIEIDTRQRTYGVASFDDLKAALQNEQQTMMLMFQQNSTVQGDQASISAKLKMLPAGGTRVVLGQSTTETKFELDTQMQSVGAGPIPVLPGMGANSASIALICDLWIAPTITGYQEFTRFRDRMKKELNWIPPSGLQDPRMSQGMTELQKNAPAMQGLPLLQYVSIAMPQMPGQPPPNSGTAPAQGSTGPIPIPSRPGPGSGSTNSTGSTNSSSTQSPLGALGTLFGKKKADTGPLGNSSTPGAPVNPFGSNTNSLVDMTIEVSSFSDSALDNAVFEVPAGYTRIQANPAQIITNTSKH